MVPGESVTITSAGGSGSGTGSAGSGQTAPGTVMGTVGYMSPEQVRGHVVDSRSDIFSFGAILYEMVAGRRAFKGDSAVETMNAVLKEEPPDLDPAQLKVSPAMERIIRHCIEKIPANRFQSARDLNFALGALSGSGSSIDASSSAQAALSYVRTHAAALGIAPDFYDKSDIHVHVPAGAIPKDGPSGGVTIAASLASLLSGRPVRSDIAMTGEITLRGKVLPVGGIKEKVLAARRAGIKTIILPRRNERDLEDIQPEVRKELEMIFVDTVDEVIRHALRDGDKVQPGAEAVAATPATARTERTVLN